MASRKRRFEWDDDGDDEGDDDHSWSSSGGEEDEVPADWEQQKTMEIHTQVCPKALEYFELREQSVEAPGSAGACTAPASQPAAPRGQAVVQRRRRRIETKQGSRSAQLEEVAKQLRGRGFVVWDNFLGSMCCSALAAGFESSLDTWSNGRLGSTESRSLRGDRIAWPDLRAPGDGAFGGALRQWMQALDELVAQLRPWLHRSQELCHVTLREPPMASIYPKGARYIRHYDNNCDEGLGDCNGRRLTAVYYLNKGITHSDGGHLRIMGQRGGVYDILPEFDTLTLFWSDRRSPHEVMPVLSDMQRLALSCWYVDPTEATNNSAEPMSRPEPAE